MGGDLGTLQCLDHVWMPTHTKKQFAIVHNVLHLLYSWAASICVSSHPVCFYRTSAVLSCTLTHKQIQFHCILWSPALHTICATLLIDSEKCCQKGQQWLLLLTTFTCICSHTSHTSTHLLTQCGGVHLCINSNVKPPICVQKCTLVTLVLSLTN